MKTNYHPNCETHHIMCECQWKSPSTTVVAACKISPGTRRRHTTFAATTSTTCFATTSCNNFMVAVFVSISLLLIAWQRPVPLIDAFMIIGHSHPYHRTNMDRGTNPRWTVATENGIPQQQQQQRRDTMMVPFLKPRLASFSPTRQQLAVKVYSNAVVVATKPPPDSTEVMVEEDTEDEVVPSSSLSNDSRADSSCATEMMMITSNNSEQVKLRMEKQLERLRLKDRLSPKLSKEELNIVYEDDHLMIVNKPAGLLTVAGKDKTNNSLVQAVYDHCQSSHNIQFQQADHMVVHRLGMDVSGLLILAKNADTMRKLNTHFRTRQMERTYEALVCGHVIKNKGRITLPLMRDYEHPLYMRVSTDQHQEALIDLDPDVVGKKLLEQPKECVTEYKVLSREELNGEPVTRLLLRSVSGRMHQLNCHLAAIGHPVVGDLSYGGINGMAAPNGGLSDDELDYMIPKVFSLQSNNRVTMEQQLRTTSVSNSDGHESIANVACHAKTIRFRHPITKKYVTFEADAPF